MSRIITLIFTICIFNFKSFAFEPYSGISCHNSNVTGKVEFFFKIRDEKKFDDINALKLQLIDDKKKSIEHLA